MTAHDQGAASGRDRPLLVDLGCGAGGASEGYYREGFDILGIDLVPQAHYPFHFVQMDALMAMRILLAGGIVGGKRLACVAAFHASMPCQRWAAITVKGRDNHPDLITPLRPLLEATGLPWVIENVPAAPLRDPVMVCGGALGCVSGDLQLHRHRMFEASFPIVGTSCVTVRPQTVSVVGHGSPTGNRGTLGRNPTIAEKREAMGIDWCNRDELSEAVPPAYTEHIGTQLLAYLAARHPGGAASVSDSAAIKLRREDYPHGDAIWEHKKGRIWQIIGRQERENRALRYQVKVLQARVRRLSRATA